MPKMKIRSSQRRRKKQSKKIFRGLRNGKIRWNLRENTNCIELAKRGISAATISKTVGLTVNQVNYRIRKIGIGLRDYRNGSGPEGEVIIKKFKIRY